MTFPFEPPLKQLPSESMLLLPVTACPGPGQFSATPPALPPLMIELFESRFAPRSMLPPVGVMPVVALSVTVALRSVRSEPEVTGA